MKKILIFFAFFVFYSLPCFSTDLHAWRYWFDDDFAGAVSQVFPIGSQTVTVNTAIPTNNLPTGLHILRWQFQDENGKWSSVQSQHFYIKASNNLTTWRYWFDDDFAGAVSQIFPVSSQTVALNTAIPTNNLPTGLHILRWQFQDENEKWSSVQSQHFQKLSNASTTNISAYRYWFDANSGGMEEIQLSVPANPATLNVLVDASSLSIGQHNIHLQFQDMQGNWSAVSSTEFMNTCAAVLEICNGMDDDCDGAIDDDSDGDGFTVCQNDCDDNNAQVNPSIQEIYNLMDDDCDGTTDELSNNEWTTAIPLTIRNYIFNAAECANEFWATTQGATYSVNPADNSVPHPVCAVYTNAAVNMEDVWVKFTATSATHVLRYTNLAATSGTERPIAAAIYRRNANNPSKLVALNSFCDKNFGSTTTNMGELGYNGFSIGTEYFVRLWMDGTNNSGLFQFYVTTKPQNDDCGTAIDFEDLCSPLVGTTRASRSNSGIVAADCPVPPTNINNSRNDDVWFKFTASSAQMSLEYSDLTVTLGGVNTLGFDYFADGGACDLSGKVCHGSFGSGGSGCATLSGLTIGNEYSLRIYGFGNNNGAMFNLSLTAGACRATNRDLTNNLTNRVREYEIFPNPAQSSLFVNRISSAEVGGGKIEILDISGTKVGEQDFEVWKEQSPIEINISQLPEGMYWLRVLAKAESPQVLKFVVARD